MLPRTLDARPSLDPRNGDFPVTAVLDRTQPRSWSWRCTTWLDQGSEGACVGNGWTHERAARPVETLGLTEADAMSLYRDAQRVDEWPGESYDGTSVLAGAKVMQAKGWMREYRWATSAHDALVAMSWKGPGVFGIPWFTGMFDVDSSGYIHPTGQIEGWHAILGRAVNITRKDMGFHNSWGQSWGVNGRARMRWDEFAEVMAVDGAEFCIPTLR